MRKHQNQISTSTETLQRGQRLQGGRGEEGARRGMTGLSLMSCLVQLFSCFQKTPPAVPYNATPLPHPGEEFVILGSGTALDSSDLL